MLTAFLIVYGLGYLWGAKTIAYRVATSMHRVDWDDIVFGVIFGVILGWAWPLILLADGVKALTKNGDPKNFAKLFKPTSQVVRERRREKKQRQAEALREAKDRLRRLERELDLEPFPLDKL